MSPGFKSADETSNSRLRPLSTTSITRPASVTWTITWSFSFATSGFSCAARATAAWTSFASPSRRSCSPLPCTTMMSFDTTFGSRDFASFTSLVIIVPPLSTPGLRKYWAICWRSLMSACVSSQSTMKSAIIAVTKSA